MTSYAGGDDELGDVGGVVDGEGDVVDGEGEGDGDVVGEDEVDGGGVVGCGATTVIVTVEP